MSGVSPITHRASTQQENLRYCDLGGINVDRAGDLDVIEPGIGEVDGHRVLRVQDPDDRSTRIPCRLGRANDDGLFSAGELHSCSDGIHSQGRDHEVDERFVEGVSSPVLDVLDRDIGPSSFVAFQALNQEVVRSAKIDDSRGEVQVSRALVEGLFEWPFEEAPAFVGQ